MTCGNSVFEALQGTGPVGLGTGWQDCRVGNEENGEVEDGRVGDWEAEGVILAS